MALEKQLTRFVLKVVFAAVLVALGVIAVAASIRLTGHDSRRDGAIQDAAEKIPQACMNAGAAPYPTYSYTVVETHNNNPNSISGDWYATIETDCQP
jgi:hypothetical protein